MSPNGTEEVPPAGEGGSEPPAAAAVHVPINVRSVSLAVLAVLGGVYTLKWASVVFIPVLLGLMISYALSPIVNVLQRWHLPRALGAALLLVAILCGSGWLLYSLSDDA